MSFIIFLCTVILNEYDVHLAIVDESALASLDIFRVDEHPSVIRDSGKNKEGFSLMSLLDRVKSSPGRKLLKTWLSNPLVDVDEINKRLNSVEILTHTKASEFVPQIRNALKELKDVSSCLERLSEFKGRYVDWTALGSSGWYLQLAV